MSKYTNIKNKYSKGTILPILGKPWFILLHYYVSFMKKSCINIITVAQLE